MPDPHPDETRMPLGEHLEELRRRILYALAGLAVGMVVGLVFGDRLLELLKYPYVRVMENLGLVPTLRVLNATAGFSMYLKVSLWAGLVIASPWVLYQLWAFVASGLYAGEKKLVRLVLPVSVGLFLGGAAFFLFGVSVPLMQFFLEFNINYLGLQNDLTLANHINMMLSMMLIFGLAFQLPVVVAVLGVLGLVTASQLAKYRRHVIVGLFILAAFLTSPSPADQILLAVPMWLLFELGILFVWLIHRKKQ